jgi:hypothetical protein
MVSLRASCPFSSFSIEKNQLYRRYLSLSVTRIPSIRLDEYNDKASFEGDGKPRFFAFFENPGRTPQKTQDRRVAEAGG